MVIERDFPISYVAILCGLVDEYGGDSNALLADTPLARGQLADPQERCPGALFSQLCRQALESTDEPALGLLYGQHLPLTSHGVLGYALLSCRNMAQVLEILMKYYRLLLDQVALDYTVAQEQVHLGYHSTGLPMVNSVFDQEVVFAGMAAALRQLLHQPLEDIRFHFRYPAPAHRDAYRRILGEQLQFEAPRNELILPAHLLDAVPEFANPAMLQLYQEQCKQTLARMEARSGLAEQIRDYLLSAHRRFPSLAETAEHFHVSTRTLRRRLERDNTSFQDIMDEVRRELAERYLRDPAVPTAQVAELLQFSDFSNFRRAFLRWTGKSPAAFRREMGG